ncbi:hypothetical protein OPS25_02490 [Alteromonas ponticola]|uniref:Flp pilus-assembly TadG-like N-terminal domain-containing protein n=1 Tax=Alteromonas aquimaris TaxID=2998417 RepID=A0ABT3P3N5_9ALTE|nr:hypothetical protein [Alteromonas aquimaris]MCW8107369.1 hypothetical protein [Alteromonas aquimaris]
MDKYIGQSGMTLLAPTTLLLSLLITALLVCNKSLLGIYAIQSETLTAHGAQRTAQNHLTQLSATLLNTSDEGFLLSSHQRILSQESITLNDVGLPIFTLSGKASVHTISRSVVESVIKFPLLLNVPPAAFSVASALPPSSKFELALPQSPADSGRAFSLWSKNGVPATGDRHISCLHDHFNDGKCKQRRISSNAQQGDDFYVFDRNFPSDLIIFLFGVDTIALHLVEAYSAKIITHCHQLNEESVGLYVIESDCLISTKSIIGTPTTPVLLISKNANIDFKPHAQFNGLFVALCVDSAVSYDITMHPSAFINGALMTDCKLSGSSHIRVSFNRPLLSALQQTPRLQQLHRIPGSWRDF